MKSAPQVKLVRHSLLFIFCAHLPIQNNEFLNRALQGVQCENVSNVERQNKPNYLIFTYQINVFCTQYTETNHKRLKKCCFQIL